MTGESTVLRDDERRRLAAVVSAWETADFVAVRALAALSEEAPERLGRFTAMGRQFIVDVRRRVHERGADPVLGEPASAAERVLETASDQIVQRGPREVTMSAVADAARVPRRSLYNMYSGSGELVEACRRRGRTMWRARFEQCILSEGDAEMRLFAVIDTLDGWVGSERFQRDQTLMAQPSFAPGADAGGLREHFTEIEHFANGLALAAKLRAPAEFSAMVTTLAAGAAAWFDRRAAARAVSIAVIERLACD